MKFPGRINEILHGGNGGQRGVSTSGIWIVSGGMGYPNGNNSASRSATRLDYGGNGGNNGLGYGSLGAGGVGDGPGEHGGNGSSAPTNSGGGGGGGGGAHHEGGSSDDNRGGAGGNGGSGYCRIQWEGFVIE